MPLIFLQVPFIHHYAGSVFDLERVTLTPQWEFEDRSSPKRAYVLPDNGKGYAVELSMSNTHIYPPFLLKDIDLTAGPCRITSAFTKSSEGIDIKAEELLTIEKTALFDIKGIEKQGIKIDIPNTSPQPQRLQILDRKENKVLKDIKNQAYILPLDFSDLTNGFYEISIFCKNDIVHTITFIKCFPLVITLDRPTGEYTTMKTIW